MFYMCVFFLGIPLLIGHQSMFTIKATPKIDPLYSAKFQRVGYATYSLQEWNPHNKLDLNLMGHK